LRRGLSLNPKESKPLSFREFVNLVKPRYQWYAHCEALANVLQQVADGKIKRLMVFMPPRHGKSELVSRLFSAYYLYLHPERWVGINSYAADLAFTLSRASRENFKGAGGQTKSDADAVKHWETQEGGGLWAAGVGGPITGKGFHLGIIDDPLKNSEEAASVTIRDKQKEWYGSTFYTREEPDGAIVVIQTRWNEDDLSGWLLAEEAEEEPEGWHIVNFEAIKDEQPQTFPETCTVEPDTRKAGEPLCKERYPIERLLKIAARIGGYFWDALFQQRPTSKEGSFFKVGRLEIVDVPPAALRKVRAWDQAATEGRGDYTAGVLMGAGGDGFYYVLDVVRGQWGTDTRNAQIKQTAQLDGHSVAIRGAQDPGSVGVDAALAFTRMLAGFTVKTVKVSGAKDVRADPFSSQVNAGNVRLVAGDWNRDFIEELRKFSGKDGGVDDQVDAASDAFTELAEPELVPFTQSNYAGYGKRR
jgi:predicted phage terminase large subunit-like protein